MSSMISFESSDDSDFLMNEENIKNVAHGKNNDI